MITSGLLIAGAFGALLHPFGPSQIKSHTYLSHGWLVRTDRDRFTNKVTCRLWTAGWTGVSVDYGGGAMRFHFPPRTNTRDAWYKIDGGVARAWRDAAPELVALDVPLDGSSLANPSGGLVILPASSIAEARSVEIRISPRSRPKAFHVAGFSAALAVAESQGCVSYVLSRP